MMSMVAGSLPGIVTRNENRRINKEGINDEFLVMYISLIYKLFKIKKNLKDIKILYLGGYLKEENNNTGKLYFRALNYYFKTLFGEEMQIDNFTILDQDLINGDAVKVQELLKEADCLFLGIGDDQLLGSAFTSLADSGINVKDWVEKNNIVVLSACAGSVLSAKNIYGSKYDSFYHGRTEFEYPESYEVVALNIFTMEANLFPERKTKEENREFEKACLLPDSFKKCFFGCKADSFMFMSGNIGYGVGEIYLFIDGEKYLVCEHNKMVNLTKLNELVRAYNLSKSLDIKEKILEIITKLNSETMLNILNNDALYAFRYRETLKENKRRVRRSILEWQLLGDLRNLFYSSGCVDKNSLDVDALVIQAMNLESNDDWEIYLKYKLISLVKKYINYYDNEKEFFADLYELMMEIVSSDQIIVYYFITCFSSRYDNAKMKRLLQATGIECQRKVNALSSNNKLLWRNENV